MEIYVAGTGSFAAGIADWARTADARVVGVVEMLDPARVGLVERGVPICAWTMCLPAGGW